MNFYIPEIGLFLILSGSFIVLPWLWYTYFLSPLASIPNAGSLAPISRLLWAFPYEFRGQISLILPLLHEKYGPLIRIGPAEVSYYSLDLYKIIHSIGSPYAKDPRVYGQFVQGDHPGLFSITDAYEHSKRRRLMGQLFNKSKMYLLEDMMLEKIAYFVEKLHIKLENPVEMIRASRALEADIVSTFGFGQDVDAITTWAAGKDVAIIKNNDERSQVIALLSSFPSLARAWYDIESVIYRFTGHRSVSTSLMDEFDEWSLCQFSHLISSKNRSPTKYPNFISTMIASGLAQSAALSEAKEMLGPGTDTTSATLAHILWALAHDESYQEQLVSDLQDAAWPTDLSSLESVPRLVAAVKEGIRWAGAAAAMLPRLVPVGGTEFAGHYIPLDSPIWYLRDRSAFPEPYTYHPIRWLDTDESYEHSRTRRNEYYIPFSKGSGTCMGTYFAYLELYLSTSQILKAFRLRLPISETARIPVQAKLPDRLEWVATVPLVDLSVQLCTRATHDE